MYKPRPIQKPMAVNKHQRKLLQDTEKRLNKETDEQITKQYHAAAIALNRMEGWKQQRILSMVMLSRTVWDDCASSNDISMVQMCEHETGIDLMSEHTEKDYEDIIYLNSASDTGVQLDIYQWIAMRQNQTKWVKAQITACILISLKRKENWGTTKLMRFLNVVNYVLEDYNFNKDELRIASRDITGFELLENMI